MLSIAREETDLHFILIRIQNNIFKLWQTLHEPNEVAYFVSTYFTFVLTAKFLKKRNKLGGGQIVFKGFVFLYKVSPPPQKKKKLVLNFGCCFLSYCNDIL